MPVTISVDDTTFAVATENQNSDGASVGQGSNKEPAQYETSKQNVTSHFWFLLFDSQKVPSVATVN